MIRVGACCTVIRQVMEEDLATSLYPELRKPPVLATARLVRWCEQAVMETIGGCTAGFKVNVRHLAPAVLGGWLIVKAGCVAVDGPATCWSVTAHDEHELIATGDLGFVLLDYERYQARLESKLPAREPST